MNEIKVVEVLLDLISTNFHLSKIIDKFDKGDCCDNNCDEMNKILLLPSSATIYDIKRRLLVCFYYYACVNKCVFEKRKNNIK
jgi:hypothetical protein